MVPKRKWEAYTMPNIDISPSFLKWLNEISIAKAPASSVDTTDHRYRYWNSVSAALMGSAAAFPMWQWLIGF